MVSSAEPDTIVFPLGVTATLWTGPLCPTNLNGRILGLKFHTMTVLSWEPEMHCFRLGLKHVEITPSLWPLNERLRAGSVQVGAPERLGPLAFAPFAPID